MNKNNTNIEEVLAERESTYGDFNTHAQITQDLKDVMHRSPNWFILSASQKEALEMNAHKIGRILNGNPDFLDSWVDIEGYIHLVSTELRNRESEKENETITTS